MSGFLCSMVGVSAVAAAAEVIRKKKGIAALGNAQVDTAQSKFGGASALFDGTDDYLQINSSDFAFGTGDFTIECWARVTTAKNQGIFHLGDSYLPSGAGVAAAVRTDVGNLQWVLYSSGTATGTSPAPSTNTWYHIAVVRSGGTTTYYVDGTSVASRADSTNYSASTYLAIGGYYSTSFLMVGNIDEFRVSKTARYTTSFTPSTTAFVNDDNTVLLIHCDGTDAVTFFEDDNGVRASKAITAINGAQIDTAQSKFGGSSAYFDGTTDYLQIPSGSGFNLSGDYTFEAWVRYTSAHASNRPVFNMGNASSGQPLLYCNSSGTLLYMVGGTNRITGSTLSLNTWYHLAVSRSGSSTKLFVDGTQVGSTYTDSTAITDGTFYIGIYPGDSNGMYGWIDEFRISNSARYTTTFTPSTTPFVNDTNTLLLMHMNGTDASTVFLDDNGTGRTQNNAIANGNAKISTTRSKFGGSSAYFDGTGDYAISAKSITFADNQDFTWEFWFNEDVSQNCKYIGGQTTNDIFVGHDGNAFSNRLGVGIVSVGWYMDFGLTPTLDTWYHFCVQRSGDTVYGYLDGVLKVTHTGSLANWDWHWRNIVFGAETTGNTPYNGYLDECRWSNTVRYATAGFTAPTAPFQNDSNTVLLMHMDGTNNSTVFTDDNGKTPT